MKATVNHVNEEFTALIPEEQEFVIAISEKIIIESRRDSLSKVSKKAVANFKARKVKKGTAKDLYKDLANK